MIKSKYMIYTGLFFFGFLSCLYLYDSIHAFSVNKDKLLGMQAHLSEQWYIHDPVELKKQIEHQLQRAFDNCIQDFDVDDIYALILPHAGYKYSGLCAAAGYSLLQKKNNIKRAIILAPSHFASFDGVALLERNMYKTCLGEVEIDMHANQLLEQSEYCNYHEDVYKKEHSVEIQLPFLQVVAPDIKIVPLLIGRLTADSIQNISSFLKQLIDGDTIIIVSSDFTHYGSSFQYTPFSSLIHEKITNLDGKVLEAVASQSSFSLQNVFNQTGATVCGRNPLALFVSLCKKAESKISMSLASYYLSGHAESLQNTKDKIVTKMIRKLDDDQMSHSVSYAAVVCSYEKKHDIQKPTAYEASVLCALARQKIIAHFGQNIDQSIFPVTMPFFQQKRGAFVTLSSKQGKLKGCIGNIRSPRPLYQTISNMAIAAAFHDHRFENERIKEEEIANIKIEISILSDPQKIESVDEIIIGKHGVILHWKDPLSDVERSAVYLPDVASAQGWTKKEMLESLSKKAGCLFDAWKDSKFEIFYVIKIGE